MSQKSKSGVFGIFLALLVLAASLIFAWCVIQHEYYGKHHGDHAEIHGTGVAVEGAFARANGASAKAGAAFIVNKNHSDEDDILIAAKTDVANIAELHTHIEDANGVMMMRPVEGGVPVPAHGEAVLKRGSDHVMMMGLKQSLTQGDNVTLILTFEKAGDITVEIPVDLTR